MKEFSMRDLIFAAKAAVIAGAALALAACGGEASVNHDAGNELEANASLDELGNDASAMEAAGNVAETPAPADNAADDAAGEDDGGDTGGNNVESNTVGM
jgi:outer membrane murein-binding lipoprotein Lpp